MMTVLPGSDRPHTRIAWLDSHHTFSFGEHYVPTRMGFRSLRVINDDVVAPGEGFGAHPHRDMEIVTYVLSGALAHRDSSGGGGVLRRGDVQRMSAGSGVVHSEFNASTTEPVHFLQIWLVPAQRGLDPGYEQRSFSPEAMRGRLLLVASADGREGSLRMNQDASLYAARLDAAGRVTHTPAPGRHVFVHVVEGDLRVNDRHCSTGDGVGLSDEREVVLEPDGEAEVLVFDLA